MIYQEKPTATLSDSKDKQNRRQTPHRNQIIHTPHARNFWPNKRQMVREKETTNGLRLRDELTAVKAPFRKDRSSALRKQPFGAMKAGF
ncbi:hypothetical protein [Prevotella sp.]|uniref:hypothetical protein n=1 Tax=Prevotella sp. TaxID=59823 RepID=UPI002F95B864